MNRNMKIPEIIRRLEELEKGRFRNEADYVTIFYKDGKKKQVPEDLILDLSINEGNLIDRFEESPQAICVGMVSLANMMLID